MTYEQRRSNLIEGLKMQVELGNWVKVAELAIDLERLKTEERAKGGAV